MTTINLPSTEVVDPQSWVTKNANTPILADDSFFNHVLGDYVADKGVGWQPYGVIVAPDAGINYLVWYDAMTRLHVIDLSRTPHGYELALAVKKPEYFEDPGYLQMWNDMIPSSAEVFGTTSNLLYVALAIGAVIFFMKRR